MCFLCIILFENNATLLAAVLAQHRTRIKHFFPFSIWFFGFFLHLLSDLSFSMLCSFSLSLTLQFYIVQIPTPLRHSDIALAAAAQSIICVSLYFSLFYLFYLSLNSKKIVCVYVLLFFFCTLCSLSLFLRSIR